MPSVPEAPVSPRQLLAQIALADHLPVPRTIHTVPGPGAVLTFGDIAQGTAWATHLGLTTAETYNSPDGHTYLRVPPLHWLGWTIHLNAYHRTPADVPGPRLDDDTRYALTGLGETAATP
jgi:hypothetical protein